MRTEKTSVYRAQLLLQTVTVRESIIDIVIFFLSQSLSLSLSLSSQHLIKVVHFEGRGLSLDILTTSTVIRPIFDNFGWGQK